MMEDHWSAPTRCRRQRRQAQMPGNLTLKQRLAALSVAPSSPSSPRNHQHLDSPSLPSPRRKGFNINNITPPWAKRPSESNSVANAELEGRELVQEVMSRLIFQAGVDYETRPMVVINASALPDPREINYDLLLSRILSYLNLYVESDYTVVFMAAGGKHSPGWNWVWKAYRSLSRKYRKNLKRLYVVHSTFFTKMLFSLAGAIISPKFFRKITYITTLSELAYHVPLTQIDIPPAAYQENLKHEKKVNLPVPTPSITFGVPLEDIMGYEGEKGGIPRVVKDAIQFLRDTGLNEEGLFRRSTATAMLRAAQEAYDRGNVVSLETFRDPHLAAVLLKKYLRDLPTPIFPETLYMVIRRCPLPTSDPADMASVMYVREVLLSELPPCVYILLSHVLHLMHEVSLRSTSNRMDAHNLAIVLCPNLVSGTSPARDVQICSVPGGPALFPQQSTSSSSDPRSSSSSPSTKAAPETTLGAIIKLCIQRYYEVFDEVVDRSEPLAVAAYPSYVDHSRGSTPEQSLSRSREASVEAGDDERRKGNVNGNNGFVRGRMYDLPSPTSPSRPDYQRRYSANPEDDEDIDDAMLVMPLGPEPGNGNASISAQQPQHGAGPPGAWDTSGGSTFRPRHRNTLSNGSNKTGVPPRSINTDYGPPSSFSMTSYATYNKAKSTISVEKGMGTVGPGRKGSISVGRGTSRKSAGSGVAAVGITAAGFFAPPDPPPPVPPLPGTRTGGGQE